MTLNDSHCHFLSARFFETLGLEKFKGARQPSAAEVASAIGMEPPGTPEALADRWLEELDRHHVSRATLIASVAGDEPSVAAALRRHPSRFVGFFALNATAPDAVARATEAFTEFGMRTACLFPALHRYTLDDERVARIFEVADAHNGAVFAHCGYLSIEMRAKFGLPGAFDMRKGDPLALAVVAAAFPRVPVIVPHFGGGFLREALMAAEACPNIVFDTSSSNNWVRFVPGLTLTEVFRRALALVGPGRLMFGSDSSYFPRGWRQTIHGAQRTILDELGTEPEAVAQIFGGTFDRLFPLRG
ncbi:MAG: amidohydrolase family protein [Vicinamibacterales bacterium]